jgi:hypothetical protein
MLPSSKQRLVQDRTPRAFMLATVGSEDFLPDPSRDLTLFLRLPRHVLNLPSREDRTPARYPLYRSPKASILPSLAG